MHESVVKVRKVFTLHLSEVDQNDPVGVRQLNESSFVDNFRYCFTVCIVYSPFHVESKGPAKRAQISLPATDAGVHTLATEKSVGSLPVHSSYRSTGVQVESFGSRTWWLDE